VTDVLIHHRNSAQNNKIGGFQTNWLLLFVITMHHTLGIAFVFLGLVTLSLALPFLASSLGSNMVLQRDQQARLWGWTSKPAQQVTVRFNNQNYVTTSDSSTGFWLVKLPPMKV
jgi:hypothetical protein